MVDGTVEDTAKRKKLELLELHAQYYVRIHGGLSGK